MKMASRRKNDSVEDEKHLSPFPDEVLERVLVFVKSHRDRSSVSLVCKDWYSAERWSRTHVFIGNCYSVSPEILVRRFPNIRSVTLKGKPRFSDFNLVPPNWGADIHEWLAVFTSAYPFLEELRLKRMTVTDESLEFLAQSFPKFKALSLVSCDGFSTDGLAAIATHCNCCDDAGKRRFYAGLTPQNTLFHFSQEQPWKNQRQSSWAIRDCEC